MERTYSRLHIQFLHKLVTIQRTQSGHILFSFPLNIIIIEQEDIM